MSGLETVAADVLEIPVAEVCDDTSPATVRTWDSMRHINLVLAIEQHFDVKFAPSEIMLISSLGAARELLTKKGAL